MNVTEVSTKIKAIDLFKDIKLDEPNKTNQYGVLEVAPRHFKDGAKNELKLGNYALFIAHMYEGSDTMDEFFYLSFHRVGEQRDFRRRSFYGIEYNRIFITGSTVDEVMTKLEDKLIGYELK